MKIKVGDYFDMYKDGLPSMRVVARDLLTNGNCLVEDILTGNEYEVVPCEEVEAVIGNIFK